MVSVDRATVSIDGFDFEDGPLCGTHLLGDATVDLQNGRITGWNIGACVQVDGFDDGRPRAGILSFRHS